MRWNMRMKAAERGIWKSTEMRRRLADAGLEISAGKMSALWTGTPTTIRLDDLDVICAVLECDPGCAADPRTGQGRRPAAQARAGRERRGGLAEGVAPVRQTEVRTASVTRPPARCNGCRVNRVAWVRPRVDYCYECLPGGPFTPPACRKCGSDRYFSEGSASGAIPAGRCIWARVGTVWPGVSIEPTTGVAGAADGGTPTTRSATANTAAGTHASANSRRCRLCLEQARTRSRTRPGDRSASQRTAIGQQLFFANMRFQRPRTPRLRPQRRDELRRASRRFRPLAWRQEPLFDMDPDPTVVTRAVAAPPTAT